MSATNVPVGRDTNETWEILRLLEAVYSRYGYDFREYSPASLKRRIGAALQTEGLAGVPELRELVLRDPAALQRLLKALTVNVTSMFRDPEYFQAFRRRVVPILRTHPFIRIWHAGCSTGEEVYSTVILLEEEGLYDRCRIYATDMNETVLRQAIDGIFPLSAAGDYTSNYLRAGGQRSLTDYYTAAYGNAIFSASLKRNLVFSQHNLTTDRSFNEFHVILCRNVMIYFRRTLQNRVHQLLYDSLGMFGILGLGSKESLRFTLHEGDYEQLEPGIRLYRRIH